MGVNEGPYPDNYSQCAECGRWAPEQVLKRIGDDLLCRECIADANADGDIPS